MLRIAQIINPYSTPKSFFPRSKPSEHSVHDFIPMQTLFRVKDRRKPRLNIDNAIVVHIFHHLVRDPFEGLLGLHHAARMGEAFQINRQTSALRATVEPFCQFPRVIRRAVFCSPCVLCQFDDRFAAKPPSR